MHTIDATSLKGAHLTRVGEDSGRRGGHRHCKGSLQGLGTKVLYWGLGTISQKEVWGLCPTQM